MTSKKVVRPPTPSATDLTVPVTCGLMDFRLSAGTGNHNNSMDEVLMVNLKVWSENFAKLALKSTGANIRDAEPAIRKNGRISSPSNIPNRERIGPVTKNCIIIEAAPAIE